MYGYNAIYHYTICIVHIILDNNVNKTIYKSIFIKYAVISKEWK